MPQQALKYHAVESSIALLENMARNRGHKVTKFWRGDRCNTVLVETKTGVRVGKFSFKRGKRQTILCTWFPGDTMVNESEDLVDLLALEGEATNGLM